MKTLNIRALWALPILLTFTAIINILVLTIPYFDTFKAAMGFVWLFLFPGWLILQILHLRTKNLWEHLGYSAGFSILAVMLTALAANILYPAFGSNQPMSAPNLLFAFDIVWVILSLLAVWRNFGTPIRIHFPKLSRPDLFVLGGGVPILVLSVLGAISLNNNGTNLFTWIMLVASAGYLVTLIALRDKLHENVVMAGLYAVGLAFLLTTSLRGWYTTGHDVQAEYHVFMVTLSNLRWDMANFRDAYNACMSITILPTVARQITGIGDVYIYKTIYQLVFALVPILVYSIARKYTSQLIALLAAIYFIAFPTFFGDMPMLNRQEVAFLFISLIFLTLFNNRWTLVQRRWLASILGLGVVLSHYSTTYTMIAIFALVVVLRGVFKFAATAFQPRWLPLRHFLNRWRNPKRAPVNFGIIVMLVVASYIWSSQFTATGGNISRVVGETIQGIFHKDAANDTRSSDTSYSLFGKPQLTDQQRLQNYIKDTVPETRGDYTTDEVYPESAYTKFEPKIVVEPDLPLTPVGQAIQQSGTDVSTLNSRIRQGSAIVLQILLVIGIFVLFIARPLSRNLTNEYRLFQLTSVCMLAAIVVLPVLSAEYGLLRAFQQTLILSGAAVAIATITLIPVRFIRARTVVPTALAIMFLLSSTGVLTTFLGGYPAQLHLSNSGKYYDLYYIHDTEQHAATWLEHTASRSNDGKHVVSVQADRPTYAKIREFTNIGLEGDLYPGVMLRDYYAFLGYTNLTKGEATVTYHGDPLTYTYPIEFLDTNKDLIYSNQGARVYR